MDSIKKDKPTCQICQVEVSNITAHNRTKKHQEKVEQSIILQKNIKSQNQSLWTDKNVEERLDLIFFRIRVLKNIKEQLEINKLKKIVDSKLKSSEIIDNLYTKHDESLEFIKEVVVNNKSILYVLFNNGGNILEYTLPRNNSQPKPLLLVQNSVKIFGTFKKPVLYIHKSMGYVEDRGINEYNKYVPDQYDCDHIEKYVKVLKISQKLEQEKMLTKGRKKSKITFDKIKTRTKKIDEFCICNANTPEEEGKIYTRIILRRAKLEKEEFECGRCGLITIED